MKRALAGAVLATALVLAGCASSGNVSSDDESVGTEQSQSTSSATLPANFKEYIFTASNGVETMCFTWSEYDFMQDALMNGVSCFPTP